MTREEVRLKLVATFQKDIGEALGTAEFPSLLDHLEDLLDFVNGAHECQHELEIGE